MTIRSAITTVVALLVCLSSPAQPSKPIHLSDGQPFEVRGKLKVEFGGWRSYLVLDTGKSYVVFSKGEGSKRVRSIELNASDGSLIAKHAGEVVVAKGHMQIELVSPYYFNGAMLMADTVTFADGTVVHRKKEPPAPPPPPASLTSYLYTITQIPNQFDSKGEAVDLKTGKFLPTDGLGSCSLSGGGDVMNCSCADGFSAIRGDVVRHPVMPADISKLSPGNDEPFPGMTQLAIPENPTRPLIIQVACRRKPAGSK